MQESDARPAVKLPENSIAVLEVVRTSDFGAFLSAGTGNTDDDILLHHGQQTAPVQVGDRVRVFLYHDPKHRLTASMRLPQIPLNGIGYVKVLLTTRFGAFVDVGTERGVFMPFSGMKGRVVPDEYVWVKLYEDKTGRLAVTMSVDKEIRALARPVYGIKTGGTVYGTVYNMTDDGAFLITREKWIAFLHRSGMMGTVRMGQEITGRVTFIRKDGGLDISMREKKEDAISSDGEKLIQYMTEHNGMMPYTDLTEPEVIRDVFGISKAAFKRAMGHLLKTGKIRIAGEGPFHTELTASDRRTR